MNRCSNEVMRILSNCSPLLANIDDIALETYYPKWKVARTLKLLHKQGYVVKHVETFWNGMFWCVRYWYQASTR